MALDASDPANTRALCEQYEGRKAHFKRALHLLAMLFGTVRVVVDPIIGPVAAVTAKSVGKKGGQIFTGMGQVISSVVCD